MEKLIQGFRQFLVEGGLSRVYKHINEHDSAILTGFRADPSDTSKCALEELSGPQTNLERNRNIKAFLLSRDYGVTKVDGSYVEDFETPEAIEVKEASLFVVNLHDNPNFKRDIIELGKKYCQDSVLFIPHGGKGAYLFGTNASEFPGFGKTIEVGNLKFGDEAEFMTRVKGKPFTVSENELILETYDKLSRNERMVVRTIAKNMFS